MKAYRWSLKDGSMRFFSDKKLENFIGGWDTNDRINGRLFDGAEKTIHDSISKEAAIAYFKNKN